MAAAMCCVFGTPLCFARMSEYFMFVLKWAFTFSTLPLFFSCFCFVSCSLSFIILGFVGSK